MLGVFLRDLAGLNQLLHQRLVFRDLSRHTAPHQIGTGITHLREVQRVA